jgi:transcriptional regulator with XRE-family HTH domain
MTNTIKLLDKYRQVCSINTDMAAAAKLGLGRSAVSAWRKGDRHAEADTVEIMCKAIGEPLTKWLPLVEAERARSPAIAKVWLRLAQAAAAFVGAFLILRHGVDVHSAAFAFSPVACIHYAKLMIVLILALAACAVIRNRENAGILE